MSNATEFRIKRDNCREAYLNGKTEPTELAVIYGVSDITVRKWIKSGKWDELFKEERKLDHEISIARKRALIQALREYAKNPADTALQSLVNLIKQNQKDSEPSKELNDYIVRFLDQVTDFMISIKKRIWVTIPLVRDAWRRSLRNMREHYLRKDMARSSGSVTWYIPFTLSASFRNSY